MPKLGKLEVIDPREVWKNEERDFTPWLAENIGQLSELLGIPITVVQTERNIGSYELDIFGRVPESDAAVIIENQLTETDHGHLGQLITYAAGLEAAIIIWIATDVRDEHKAAVDWLNQHSSEEVSYFLVKPEVFSIDGSAPAVRFDLVAAPSEFSRRVKGVVQRDPRPSHEFRRKFWEALLAYLADNGHPWAAGRSTTKDHWIASAVGRSGVGVHVSMATDSRMRVEIYLSSDSAKQQFDAIREHKPEVEKLLAPETVSWERLEDAVAARVAVYRHYDKTLVTEDGPERRELFVWVGKQLTALRAIAKKYVVEVSA